MAFDLEEVPTLEAAKEKIETDLSPLVAKFFMGGKTPKGITPEYDFKVFDRARFQFDARFLHKFFETLYVRLKKRGRYNHNFSQDLRYMVGYEPGDYAYAAVLTQIEVLNEAKKIKRGENPYPIGDRYPPPPPIPGLKIGPNEELCKICQGSGREQLGDLTIDVCLMCNGKGKTKKKKG